jgi:hypothetical protein
LDCLDYLGPLAAPRDARAIGEATLKGRRVIRAELTQTVTEAPGYVRAANIAYLDAESLLPVEFTFSGLTAPGAGGAPVASTTIYESTAFIPLGELPKDFFSIEAFAGRDLRPVPVSTQG